jgi:glycosyltransferase involved in cell wall biosynthesis
VTVPLVTTIIPVFNRAAMLRQAVASVLAQTWRPIEIVIVDDGSTDDTPAVADALAREHGEIRVIHEANGGPGLAREAGRRQARGELLQYLDSDDLLLPRKFELQVAALRDHPECGIAYGHTRYADANGVEIECTWKTANRIESAIFPSFLVARWWETVTPLYRAAVCEAAGPWTAMRLEEDWEYDCRIGADGVRLAHVPEVVAVHRDHDTGRLSRGAALDPARLRDRARSHELIYSHARRAGIGPDAPEMRHFARELFHLARQCGAAGLPTESETLFRLSRAASGERANAMQFRAYAALARMVGWPLAGRIACLADRLRR